MPGVNELTELMNVFRMQTPSSPNWFQDFIHELGAASGGNIVYPSSEDCRKGCAGHIEECGIVEVEIRARRIIQQPQKE